MYHELAEINVRPEPFEFYTAAELWTDDHTSQQMLEYHLNDAVDLSSRNSKFIDRSVAWIVSHFNVGAGTHVADFGCGPGLYTNPLAAAGARVTGIDFSARSIQYAREVAARQELTVNYVAQNYLEFETDDRFDLILMIFCDFCALSPSQRQTLLRKFHAHLKHGGAVFLDVLSLNAYHQREESATYERNLLDGFWSPDDYYGFLNVWMYEKEHVVLDKYTIVEASRTRTVYNWLQYFSPQSIKAEFQANGFTVEEIYSDVAGAPFQPYSDELAVVAKKPSG